MLGSVRGKRIIITGGTSGIGQGIAILAGLKAQTSHSVATTTMAPTKRSKPSKRRRAGLLPCAGSER